MGRRVELAEYGKPPSTHEVERAFLGCVVCYPETIPDAMRLIDPDDLRDRRHHIILDVIYAMQEGGKIAPDSGGIDITVLIAEIRRRGLEQESGGLAYLSSLDFLEWASSSYRGAGGLREYAEAIIRTNAAIDTHGSLVRALGEISKTGDPLSAQTHIRIALQQCESGLTSEEPGTVDKLVERVAERYEEIYYGRASPGIRTGFPTIDRKVTGIQPGDLWVVGAYTSVGKTTFMEQLMLNGAEMGATYLYVSLEMAEPQMGQRLLHRHIPCSLEDLRGGRIDPARVRRAVAEVNASEWRSRMDLRFPKSREVLDIERMVLSICRDRGDVDIVVVDHLHELQVRKAGGDKKRQLSYASERMKELAMTCNAGLILPAQITRAGKTASERPRMWHLKESGDIESKSDGILMLHRPPGKSLEVWLEKFRQGGGGDDLTCATLDCNPITRALTEHDAFQGGTYSWQKNPQ